MTGHHAISVSGHHAVYVSGHHVISVSGHQWKQGQWTKEEVELLQANIANYCKVSALLRRGTASVFL